MSNRIDWEYDDDEWMYDEEDNPRDKTVKSFTYETEYRIKFRSVIPKGMTRAEYDRHVDLINTYIRTLAHEIDQTREGLKEAGWEVNPPYRW